MMLRSSQESTAVSMAGSIESVRSNLTSQSIVSPVGVEVTSSARRGNYRGEQVKSTQADSKLSRASEDMRSSRQTAATRVDLRTAQIRMMRKGQATNQQATSRIAEYRDKLPDMPPETKLRALAKELETIFREMPEEQMLQQGRESLQGDAGSFQRDLDTTATEGDDAPAGDVEGSTAQTDMLDRSSVASARQRILAKLQEFDGDVSHQFAALDILSSQFEEADAPAEFLEALDLARQSFEEPGVAQEVRAGLAAGRVAHEMAATLETDPGLVRNGYRTLLREQSNLGGLFDQLSRFDLSKKFDAVINTFLSIAGRDLELVDHSSDPALLHGLIRELSKLKTMNTVFDQSRDLVSIVERMLDNGERGRIKPEQLTSSLLHFAATLGATPRDARQLMRGLEDLSAQARVMLGNGVKDLHSGVPDDVFPSSQARSQQKAALMGFLGELVDEEEREHESS